MASSLPPSSKITQELKKRVEDAVKEFKFTKQDIDVVEKAVSVLFKDEAVNNNIRVAAAIYKYKFAYEEITTLLEALREEESNSTEDVNVLNNFCRIG